MSDLTCTIDGCARPHRAKGLCWTHYSRKRKGANLDAPVGARFSTTEDSFKSRIAPVAESGCMLWTGSTTHNGYGQLWDGTKKVRAHRYAWERANGPVPEGLVIDHACGNRACVNVEHLRVVTQADNSRYLTAPNPRNTSGYRGVSFSKEKGRWRAYGTLGLDFNHLGYYDSPEEAAEASRSWRIRNYALGEFPG